MLCKVTALDPCFQTQAVSLGLSSWRCLCRCGRERACVCTSEGLLRDVAPVGGVLAQRERGIATPPHHCNAAGLRLNAPTTTYRISSSPAHTHRHWLSGSPADLIQPSWKLICQQSSFVCPTQLGDLNIDILLYTCTHFPPQALV